MAAETDSSNRRIPVANIYYLLAYAWGRLDLGDLIPVGEAAAPTDLTNLLARLLAEGTGRLLRRGIDHAYRERTEETCVPRGRLDLASSIGRGRVARQRVKCASDELSCNCVHNRIIKAGLRALVMSKGLTHEHATQLRGLLGRLRPVDDVPLRLDLFQQARRVRRGPLYGMLLQVCLFICARTLADRARRGDGHVRDPTGTRTAMGALFEAFLRAFYRREQRVLRPMPRALSWGAAGSAAATAFVPALVPDVTLVSASRVVVVEAKFYRQALVCGRRSEKKRIRPDHLRQLFAYLHNFGRDGAPTALRPPAQVEGLLLYPAVDQTVDLAFELRGHPVRVATVDLAAPWPSIHRRLLALIAAPACGRERPLAPAPA